MPLSTKAVTVHPRNAGRMQQAYLSIVFPESAKQLSSLFLGIFSNTWQPICRLSWLPSTVDALCQLRLLHRSQYWFKNFLVATLVLYIVSQIPLLVYHAELKLAAMTSTHTNLGGNPAHGLPYVGPPLDAILTTRQGSYIADLLEPASMKEHCLACGPRAAAAPWNTGIFATTCDLYSVLGLDTPLLGNQYSTQWQYTQRQIHLAALRQLDNLEQESLRPRSDDQQQNLEKLATESLDHYQGNHRLAAVVLRARKVLEDPGMRAAYNEQILRRR